MATRRISTLDTFVTNCMQLLLVLFIFTGCYTDNEENLYGDKECETGNISYSQDVQPVIEQNCYACHSAASYVQSGSGLNFEGYELLLESAQNGSLSASINHSSGASPMPKGGSKLSVCDIYVIDTWIDQGSLDN